MIQPFFHDVMTKGRPTRIALKSMPTGPPIEKIKQRVQVVDVPDQSLGSVTCSAAGSSQIVVRP